MLQFCLHPCTHIFTDTHDIHTYMHVLYDCTYVFMYCVYICDVCEYEKQRRRVIRTVICNIVHRKYL